MAMPIIHTSATNLELSQERKALVERKLYPLYRLLPRGSEAEVDVVIRRVKEEEGDIFSVSAKLSTKNETYMAIATGQYLTRALSDVREYLRHSLCYGQSVPAPSFAYSRSNTITR